MALVRLPGALRDAAGGENKLQARGATLAEVFDDIERRHPGFRSRVVDDAGALRAYVNVYIRDADARLHGGMSASVGADDEILVIPAMAGGALSDDPLVLRRELRDAILAHALEEAPRECCGIVVGLDGVAERVIRCRNADPQPNVRYTIDPADLYAAIAPMRDEDRELVAIYHSHPTSPPVPSPTDRAEAGWPRARYILASWRTGSPELHAYRIEANGMSEVPVAVT